MRRLVMTVLSGSTLFSKASGLVYKSESVKSAEPIKYGQYQNKINEFLFNLNIWADCLNKKCKPRSDAAELGVWSGSTLFDIRQPLLRHINR